MRIIKIKPRNRSKSGRDSLKKIVGMKIVFSTKTFPAARWRCRKAKGHRGAGKRRQRGFQRQSPAAWVRSAPCNLG